MEEERRITTQQFVELLLSRMRLGESIGEGAFPYGYHRGWLEEQDRVMWEQPVERRSVARIIHEFLRREWKEEDEADWGNARRLKDFYDCRACVNHVAQIYAKGIMSGITEDVFGMREGLTETEAKGILERMSGRREGGKPETERPPAGHLTLPEALERIESDKKVVLVDVRTQSEFEQNHLPRAISFPFTIFLEHSLPYENRMTAEDTVLLYCDRGYRSRIAAHCLAEAGYGKVYYFEWEPETESKEQ